MRATDASGAGLADAPGEGVAGDGVAGRGGTARLGPLALDSGGVIDDLAVAYRAYGALDAAGANAVLVCHALTGDQHVASPNPVTGRPGWWTTMVGPGRPIDTDRFFVVCANVLGGCAGTTGPASPDPATGRPRGLDFPLVTVRDMVRAQAMLLDHLGVAELMLVAGGSMGGMQVLEWAASHPSRVAAAMPIATAARHSAQNIALHEVGRRAVMADPDWRGGAYHDAGTRPAKGLAVARMAAHVTYLSEEALARKFGRRFQGGERNFSFDADFEVESYLRHQGKAFVERFDANSYLYLTRAMDHFDLAADAGGRLADAFRGTRARFHVASFTSDWLFPPAASRALVRALHATAARTSYVEIASDKGHDAFLLDEPELFATARGFVDALARHRGVK